MVFVKKVCKNISGLSLGTGLFHYLLNILAVKTDVKCMSLLCYRIFNYRIFLRKKLVTVTPEMNAQVSFQCQIHQYILHLFDELIWKISPVSHKIPPANTLFVRFLVKIAAECFPEI